MSIQGLNHFTLRCDADQLDALRDFYCSVFDLTVGARPNLRFGGYWLYASGRAVVHLYASGSAPSPDGTALDHIAFSATDLEATRAALTSKGIDYTEAPVPGFPLHQVFVRDPSGFKLELTFQIDAPSSGIPS